MKLDFKWSDDNKYHQYCLSCHRETVERKYENGRTYYYCRSCHQTNDRSIVIDPGIVWWQTEDKEYWHESTGVFVRNPDNKFLFFERTIFPFALTVPSGHVDRGEEPKQSAIREMKEETNLVTKDIEVLGVENIVGDSCRRGADAHKWHAYIYDIKERIPVKIQEEGIKPVWLTLDEAKNKQLIFPVQYIIDKYYHELCSGVAGR